MNSKSLQEFSRLPESKQAGLLALVGTLPGVCQNWDKTRKAVLMQIYKGRILATQDGSTWLVYLPSVYALWGNPIGDDNDVV